MKRLSILALALSLMGGVAHATTWYSRADGGTLYNASTNPTGKCDGQGDAAYPGAGTNQHCAVSTPQYLYLNGVYGSSSWSTSGFAGGDTLVIEGCAALPGEQNSDAPHCRIGTITNNNDSSSSICQGVSAPWGCSMPPPPAGTSGAHTRILGACAVTSSCTGPTTYPYTTNNLTQLFGGFDNGILDLNGTQYVDIEGLEFTSHNGACSRVGSPAYPTSCAVSSPVSDFSPYGISTDNTTSNILFKDLYIHGFTSVGIGGPIGGPITLDHVSIDFNTFAGWNFDDGVPTPDAAGSSITQSYVSMVGNGCLEEYPIVHTQFPAKACWDSGTGGFGDVWSGQATELDSFTCDHCYIAYNAKDGAIGPHTLLNNLGLTNSTWYGNQGAAGKWGMNPGSTTLIQNNLIVSNQNRMADAIPGAAQNFSSTTGLPGSYLTGPRGTDGFAYFADTGSTTLFAGNTFISTSPTMLDLSCGASGDCTDWPYIFTDNILLGYTSTPPYYPASGAAPGAYYLTASGNVTATYNAEYGVRNGSCPGATLVCADPLLVNEPSQGSWPPEDALDVFLANILPNTGSPVIHAGTAVSGMTTDIYGASRPNPPTIGAAEPAAPTAATPTFNPIEGSYAGTTVVTTSTSTSACSAYLYTGTVNPPTSNTNTISVATSETVYSYVHGCPGYLDSTVAPGVYTITIPSVGGTKASGNINFSGKVVVQ